MLEIPEQLHTLNKLEVALICKRLLFKKITIIPKGQMPKLKGAICNIPVSVNETSTTLPRNLNSSGIVLVKLKKKLEFHGHVYFQPVSSEKLVNALLYFKIHNNFYEDVEIDITDLPPELLDLNDNDEINIEQNLMLT